MRDVIDNLKDKIEKSIRKIRMLEKELSRRTEGGANWEKTKVKLEKARDQLKAQQQHLERITA